MNPDEEYQRFYQYKDFDDKWKWPRGPFDDDNYRGRPVSYMEMLDAVRRQEKQIMGLHDEMRRLQMSLSVQMYGLAEKLERLSNLITPSSLELKHSLDDILEKTDADSSSVPV